MSSLIGNIEIILTFLPQDQLRKVPGDLSWGDLPCRLVGAFPACEGRKSLWHKFHSPKSLSLIDMGRHSAAELTPVVNREKEESERVSNRIENSFVILV